VALSRSNHLSEEKSDTSGALSVNFTAFTPQSSSLLVVFVYYVGNAAPGTTGALSGGGLTWTMQQRSATGTDSTYVWLEEIWTAPVGVAASTTLTYANASITITDSRVQVSAFSYTGYDTGTPTGGKGGWDTTTDGIGSGTIDAAPSANDAVVSGRIWVPTGGANTTATPETGSTEIHEVSGTAGYGNLETQERLSNTSTTVGWNDVNDSGAAGWANQCRGAALVIKADAGGGGGGGQVGISVSPLFILGMS
jgi:hypothetical protein